MLLLRKTPSPIASSESKGALAPARRAFRFRLAALALAGVALIVVALAVRSNPTVRDAMLRGKELPELEAEVRSHPRDPVAHYYLAKSYYMRMRFPDAQTAYETAVKLDPRSARAHLGLALSLFELGRMRDAQGEFEETLRLDGRSAWAEYMLGKILWLDGRTADALPHMQRSTQIDPRSDQAWFGLGVCYEHLRRYNDAIEPMRQAILHKESSAQYHTALGEVLAFRGDSAGARAQYERALELNPNYGPACQLMGGFYLHKAPGRDSLDRAQELLLRATHLPAYQQEQLYLDLGDMYSQKGEYAKAAKALEESIRRDPRDERAHYLLAGVYRHLGRTKEADATAREFKRISDAHNQLQTQEARVFHDPNNAEAHLSLARLYRELGLTDKVIPQYAAALRIRPKDAALVTEAQAFVDEQRQRRAQQESGFDLP